MSNFPSNCIATDAPQVAVSSPDSVFRRLQAAQVVKVRSLVWLALLAVGFAPASWAQAVVPAGDVARKLVVSGVMQDQAFTPLSDINVQLTTDAGLIYSTRSDSKGKFRFKVLSTDAYRLHARRGEEMAAWDPQLEATHTTKPSGHSRWHTLVLKDQEIDSTPGPTPEPPPAVIVEPGYHIHGTVLEADGSPAQSVVMRVSSGLGKFFEVPTDENARFSFRSEGDESFWIHPIQTVGGVSTSHAGKKATPEAAREMGERGFIFTLPPAEGEATWSFGDGLVMGGVVGGTVDQVGVVDTLPQPNKADASEPLRLEVFPNLAYRTMSLSLNVPVSTKLMVRMIDPDGQALFNQEFVFGPDESVFLPIGRRPAGVYTIELHDARGKTVSQQLHLQ